MTDLSGAFISWESPQPWLHEETVFDVRSEPFLLGQTTESDPRATTGRIREARLASQVTVRGASRTLRRVRATKIASKSMPKPMPSSMRPGMTVNFRRST